MIARESICSRAHPWSRLISRRSTWTRSKMTTGSASFERSSARKTFPEALLNSETPSTTWLLVGCLFPAEMIMLCGTSNGVLATAGAARAGGPFATPARSEAAFGGLFDSEVATEDRSSVTTSEYCCFADREDREDTGGLAAVSTPPFSTLYR